METTTVGSRGTTIGLEGITGILPGVALIGAIAKEESEKALQCGPLEYRFPGSRSKILDFLLTFREFDYSVTDIAKNSGLSFKTTLNEIKILKNQNVIINSRNVGKALMFKLNMNSESVQRMDKMAMEITTERINEQIEQEIAQ